MYVHPLKSVFPLLLSIPIETVQIFHYFLPEDMPVPVLLSQLQAVTSKLHLNQPDFEP